MGKDHELLQAVKTEDLLTVQKLLQRPRPGKASKAHLPVTVDGGWRGGGKAILLHSILFCRETAGSITISRRYKTTFILTYLLCCPECKVMVYFLSVNGYDPS